MATTICSLSLSHYASPWEHIRAAFLFYFCLIPFYKHNIHIQTLLAPLSLLIPFWLDGYTVLNLARLLVLRLVHIRLHIIKQFANSFFFHISFMLTFHMKIEIHQTFQEPNLFGRAQSHLTILPLESVTDGH